MTTRDDQPLPLPVTDETNTRVRMHQHDHVSNKRPRISAGEEDDEIHNRQQDVQLPDQQQQPQQEQQQQQQHAFCLVEDVFSIVMSLLAPREMLCLSRCSKSLMNMVTHENVVRNTIMMGGHPRKSLRALMDLLHDKKVFFPSAMRLLRVACGQHCEITDCTKTVHTIRSHYGVFCCFNCAQKENVTTVIAMGSDTWSGNQKLRDAVNHPRTAQYPYQRKISMWRSPLKMASGERCGPLVTMDEIQDLLAKNKTVDDHILGLACEYDKDLLDSLIKMDQTATGRAAANEGKEKKEREKRVRLFRRQKADKLERVLVKIKMILDPRWKDFALNKFYYSNDGWSRFRQFPDAHHYNPKFESPLVRNIDSLDKLLHAPSRHGVQKRITRMADAIDKVFEKIFDKGFHDFSFLSSDKQSMPFEAYLQAAMREKFTVDEWLVSLDQHDVDKLDESGSLVALACKLSGERERLWKPPACFAAAVVPYINISADDKRDTDDEFAKAIWTLKTYEDDWGSFTYSCRKTFEYTVDAFKTLRPMIVEYLKHPDTIIFLTEQNGRNDSWLRVKREEVNKVWLDRELLLHFLSSDVDFDTLREEQATGAENRWLGGHW
mmetsp:Transcript_15223/g.25318  ORF Transcript_15223/g.25318 Transcript_15223/m.25318 type:complete len:606 (-) Transcript_15223:223-2040(-)